MKAWAPPKKTLRLRDLRCLGVQARCHWGIPAGTPRQQASLRLQPSDVPSNPTRHLFLLKPAAGEGTAHALRPRLPRVPHPGRNQRARDALSRWLRQRPATTPARSSAWPGDPRIQHEPEVLGDHRRTHGGVGRNVAYPVNEELLRRLAQAPARAEDARFAGMMLAKVPPSMRLTVTTAESRGSVPRGSLEKAAAEGLKRAAALPLQGVSGVVQDRKWRSVGLSSTSPYDGFGGRARSASSIGSEPHPGRSGMSR